MSTQISSEPKIEPEFYDRLVSRLQQKFDSLQAEINQMYDRSPQLRELTIEKIEGDLRAIEADTYAEFVRSGELNELPSSLLEEVFQERKKL
ncbi:MAG: hypothetical protein U7126_22375 [Microcoleus sp.]